MSSTSHYYPTIFKQKVVDYYDEHQPNISFRQLARLFNIQGGHKTVLRWYNQRNSLENKSRSGRPCILNEDEMNEYIYEKIKEKNQSGSSIHYPELLPAILHETGKNVSLRTIQRSGYERLGIKMKTTSKRTQQECNFIIHKISYIHVYVSL